MSYNGSGTFQINTSGQPVVAGTVISSTAFNALTADLATGLSTAITKDGQTTATARIPFAQGISSTLTTDSSSVSTGSIITAGGAGIAKNLYVGVNANVAGTLGVTGVATFSAAPIYSSLTASSAVATDASKALVSVTNTGTGNNVLATSPTLVTPVLGAASATSITVAAGTVSDPAITTAGDTNTGIFFPAADTIAFAEGGAEAMRIDSDGDVGIGTTAPADKLHVAFSIGGLGGIRVQNTNASGQAALSYYNDTATQKADIWWNNSGSILNFRTLSTDPMVFSTNNAERMRIDSSGKVGINTSGAAYGGTVFRLAVNDTNYCMGINATAGGTTDMIDFYSSGTFAGKISSNGATTAYTSASDYRLKDNIVPMTGALAKVSALKPCTYKWKSDGSDGEGFIAHELAEVCPYAVNGEKDEVDSEGNIRAQSIDTSFLVATLTAAIQELKALVDTQSSTITALTARITALEAK